MLKIKTNSRNQLILSAKLTAEVMAFYDDFPSFKKYNGRDLIIRQTGANIEHLTSFDGDFEYETDEAKLVVETFLTKKEEEAKLLMQRDVLNNSYELKTDFEFARSPMKHQVEAFLLSRDKEYFALFHEQGLGKTKTTIDSAVYLYEKELINCLVVIAHPNGLHRNWTDYEIPEDVPKRIDYSCFAWSSKFGKKRKELMYEMIESKGSEFKIFAFNVEAFSSDKARKPLLDILKQNQCMLVIDQSASIKNSQAKRTKFLVKDAANFAKYKRILDGSPLAENPSELYSQFMFLNQDIIGHDTWTGFKNEFCTIGRFNEISGYRNIERLMSRIQPYLHRALEEECLDLPKRIYKTFCYDLSPTEMKIYEELRVSKFTLFEGDAIDAPLPIVKSIRMQQVTSGWFSGQDSFRSIEETPTRVKALKDLISTFGEDEKVLIFSRFKADMKVIKEALGDDCVDYYGDTEQEQREINKREYQQGKARFLVGNQTTMGIGHTFTATKHVIFYANSHALRARIESEKRAHRKGQEKQVIVWDLIANNTQDKKIRDTLRNKKQVADIIMGDPDSFFMGDAND